MAIVALDIGYTNSDKVIRQCGKVIDEEIVMADRESTDVHVYKGTVKNKLTYFDNGMCGLNVTRQ